MLATGTVIVQLPSAGMFALARLTEVAVLLSESAAPVQEVAGAAPVATLRFAGSVSAKCEPVSAKPFELTSVSVSIDTLFRVTVDGENDSLTVGAFGLTVSAPGQALALVPADTGAVLVAPPAVSVTVSTSTLPSESVTDNVSVPGAGFTLTCALLAPLTMRLAGEALHAYEAMLKGAGGVASPSQPATLPLASRVAPAVRFFGITITPIGLCAAFTALNAFTMPAPHWLPSFGQTHSPLELSVVGQVGTPAAPAGKAVALLSRRSASCAGVKL